MGDGILNALCLSVCKTATLLPPLDSRKRMCAVIDWPGNDWLWFAMQQNQLTIDGLCRSGKCGGTCLA